MSHEVPEGDGTVAVIADTEELYSDALRRLGSREKTYEVSRGT